MFRAALLLVAAVTAGSALDAQTPVEPAGHLAYARYPTPVQHTGAPSAFRDTVRTALRLLAADPRVVRQADRQAGCGVRETGGRFRRVNQWTTAPSGQAIQLEVTTRRLADDRLQVMQAVLRGGTADSAGLRHAWELTLYADAFVKHHVFADRADRPPVRWDMYPASDEVAEVLRTAAQAALAQPCRGQ